MKKCFKCGNVFPVDFFYVHKKMADGRLNKCKNCCKKDVSKNYKQKKEYYKEYEKKRANLPHRVEARKDYAKTESYKISHAKSLKKHKELHPKKYKARTMVGNALKYGFLMRKNECENCGSTKKIEAHHDDYNKPLDVRWLCNLCHSTWHKNNKAIE
jgi:hypothetical protein